MLNQDVITKAKEKGVKLSMVIAGAGVGLFDLFRVPGCSAVMTEAVYLYDAESYERFFDNDVPEVGFVSEDMAEKMALELASKRSDAINIAVTAAVKTNRERRGADRGHVAIFDNNGTLVQQHVPVEGETRDEQDQYLTDKVFELILEVLDA